MITKLPEGYTAIKEPKIVADGMYNVQVMKVEDAVSKSSGNDMAVLTVKILEENAPLINIYIVDNFDEDFKILNLKRMIAAFGVEDDGVNINYDHFEGQHANLHIGIKESDDPEFPDAKNVLYFPKLPEE